MSAIQPSPAGGAVEIREIPCGRVVRYPCERFGFREWAAEALGSADLETLHEVLEGAGNSERHRVRKAAVAALERHFEALRPSFERFVAEIVVTTLGPLVSYQSPPIFRVAHHGSPAISPIHRDRDHSPSPSDSPVLRRNRNVWVPLTAVHDSSALWVERAEGEGDFAPVALDYGEALVFDGMNVAHGSRDNVTGATRVSFELRALPVLATELDDWLGVYDPTALHGGGDAPRRGPPVVVESGPTVRIGGKPVHGARYTPAGCRLEWGLEANETAGSLRFAHVDDRLGGRSAVLFGTLQAAGEGSPTPISGKRAPAVRPA